MCSLFGVWAWVCSSVLCYILNLLESGPSGGGLVAERVSAPQRSAHIVKCRAAECRDPERQLLQSISLFETSATNLKPLDFFC
uniref:Putative secreted protein n=1 Tax=Ixodes ricinus TaxID=34613 RepID=A0A147BC62_IXORI